MLKTSIAKTSIKRPLSSLIIAKAIVYPPLVPENNKRPYFTTLSASLPPLYPTLNRSVGRKRPSSTFSTTSQIPRRTFSQGSNPASEAEAKMVDQSTSTSESKLADLRSLMKENGVDVYVIPSEDAHLSEYITAADGRREYMTHFTGSAGTAIVTMTDAKLWTDGRYWLQAAKQLGEGWTLMKSGLPEVPTWQNWLKNELPKSTKIGIDPTVIAFSESSSLKTSLKTPKLELIPVIDNLVDIVWAQSRPARPSNEVFRLGDEYAGENVGSKIHRLREKLGQTASPGMVITQLDEICWMFNLRGSDIPFNPVFFAYSILTEDECTLFINPTCLNESVRDYLHRNGVAVLEYSQIWTSLDSFGLRVAEQRKKNAQEEESGTGGDKGPKEITTDKGEKIVKTDKILVGKKTSWGVVRALGEENVDVRRSIVDDEKAKKNATEMEGFRQCNIRDGAALCRYFAWLEEVLGKGETWSEYDAAIVLEKLRRENDKFMGLSFETISSTGPNAAVIHYQPTKENTAIIDPKQVYLCDSGAQYLDGTTDTTRTLHFGTPSEAETRAYTRVLQGHIALDTMIFPQNTSGLTLDTVARRPLWQDGMDFRHGTGHGVGHFLNVHEGPQGISPRVALAEIGFKEGMVVSNEPGYYADGKWGIRLENVVGVKMAQTKENFGGKGYLEFEHFTMVPMQTKMVQKDLLSPTEVKWINEYHAEILEKVTPVLEHMKDERAAKWLARECQAI